MKVKLNSSRAIGFDEEPYIISEIGSNHNGDMKIAKKLIEASKDAGADCVKFQSWSKESIFSKKKYQDNFFLDDDYRKREDFTLEEIVEKYSISEEELAEMNDYSKKIGIDFTSTPFSRKEVDFLVDSLDVPFIKIASMDLNNYPYLDYIARKNKPMILSTGLSTLSEIDKAVETIEDTGNSNLIILHCVATYPPKDEDMNLRNINTLSKIYSYPIGFSDHSIGPCLSVAAVANNACVIEKHFTLDKNMEGWDHSISADPKDMKSLVIDSKRVFSALGKSKISRTESKERVSEFRRSIVASRDISSGEIFTEDMLDYKRPGIGLSPENNEVIVGSKATRNISFDDIILLSDFK
jgi:N-acetylneuraminate synthase